MAKPKPRPETPRPMRLTERDKHILQTIAEFEGLMSRRQIAEVCFGGNQDTAKKRLRTLFENGFIRQPSEREVHRLPEKEWIYWLDMAGLEVVAGLNGDEPRQTDKAKHEAPQWAKIEHDLALNDFRLMVVRAVAANPSLRLGEWINEKTITHWADEVKYVQPNGRPAKKKFAPDGFFTIIRPRKGRPGEEEVFAFLVEIDQGTHDNPSFGDEKVRPGIAYLTSRVYEARYGIKFGRYLVVSKKGGKRLENMMGQTARVDGGSKTFYFAHRDSLTPENILTAPVWLIADKSQPFAIIPPG